jgi:hypothetical protein
MLVNLIELDLANLLIRERVQRAARESLAAQVPRRPRIRERWIPRWNWR